ncbi:hypothetical protein ACH79_26420 [Bradyrhizobium sp. CCBAU 051011]|nr:hypothetical protein ACH79_26420 [Bradyrhizobium sp. CCBAU 051011]
MIQVGLKHVKLIQIGQQGLVAGYIWPIPCEMAERRVTDLVLSKDSMRSGLAARSEEDTLQNGKFLIT